MSILIQFIFYPLSVVYYDLLNIMIRHILHWTSALKGNPSIMLLAIHVYHVKSQSLDIALVILNFTLIMHAMANN